jgi:hypothetical protein
MHNSRKVNDGVLKRTRSKISHLIQSVSVRTRPKMQITCNLSVPGDMEADGSTCHNCSLECSAMNKTQTWVIFCPLSLSNPTLIATYARSNNLLQNTNLLHHPVF